MKGHWTLECQDPVLITVANCMATDGVYRGKVNGKFLTGMIGDISTC